MAKNILQNSCDAALAASSSGTAAVVTPQPLVLVKQQNPSGSTSVTFTTLANYPYKNYKLTFRGQISAAYSIGLLLSTNNGASYISTSSYQGGANYLAYQGTTFSTGQSGNVNLVLHPAAAGVSIGIDVNLYNIGYVSPNYTCCSGSSTYYDGTSVYYNIITGSFLISTVNVNAFKIFSSAAMTGTFNLYGYNS